jgi:hypothetical protein
VRTQVRALSDSANKVEKVKNQKGGQRMWTEVEELGELVRKGETKWEELHLDDIDVRLKWAGLFHRRKRAPGTFMMRLKVGPPHHVYTAPTVVIVTKCWAQKFKIMSKCCAQKFLKNVVCSRTPAVFVCSK